MKMIQVGVCAMRDPITGAFLEATPIFEEETEEHRKARDRMIADAGKFFASLMAERNK